MSMYISGSVLSSLYELNSFNSLSNLKKWLLFKSHLHFYSRELYEFILYEREKEM